MFFYRLKLKKRELKEKLTRARVLGHLLRDLDGVLAQLREGDELFIGHTNEGNIPGWSVCSYRVVRIGRRRNGFLRLFFGKTALPVVEAVCLGGRSQSRSSVNHYAVMESAGSGEVQNIVSLWSPKGWPVLKLGGLNLSRAAAVEKPQRYADKETCREHMHDDFLAIVRPDGVIPLLY